MPRFATFLNIFVSLLLMSSCQKKTADTLGASTPGTNKPMVMTEQLTEKELYDVLLYPARVDAGAQAGVLAETDGIVSTVKTSLGRTVQKGDVILTIENPDPVYRYAPIAVTAPVHGVISFLDTSVGNRVERGHKLAVIADIRALKISLEATANDLSSIKIGDFATFNVSERSIKSRVTAISPVVDPATGTATVELMPPRSEKLLPGMLGRAEFRVRERRGVQVPDSALVFRGTDPYLRIVESGVAHWKRVKIGGSAGGYTDISEGAKVGDNLIVRATSFIADGDLVEIQAAKQGEVARQ